MGSDGFVCSDGETTAAQFREVPAVADDVDKRGNEQQAFRQAVTYGVSVIAVAAVVGVLTTVWAANRSACAAADTRLCDDVAKTAVLFGPGVILLAGGLGAFVVTFRRFRAGRNWRAFQGAGWFLFVLMTAYLAIGAGSLAR
ncbi:hypothetical protein [Nocardia mangyaensis]|uniref:hypothetical protein n=1 Tax=Nocardia mangyaensis TaxID=2213200 RepID=UPI002676CA7B|nr:hypothetical protein [Nocardia mangyaensis]MDO3646286.1 hypothetical protein [Nocardia mangyaensis]